MPTPPPPHDERIGRAAKTLAHYRVDHPDMSLGPAITELIVDLTLYAEHYRLETYQSATLSMLRKQALKAAVDKLNLS